MALLYPFYLAIYILSSLLHITTSDTSTCATPSCSNLNPPSNLVITCSSSECTLDCTTSNSCSNILYTCGNINDSTTTCTINCLSSNSCTNLTVMSTSADTYINCATTDSCIDSNFICNPSQQLNTPECRLYCSSESCSNINYYCTGYTSICRADCNDIESCNALDMICDEYQNINNESNIHVPMQCDLFCNNNASESCDIESKFTCTKSSNAQCKCTGNCNALNTYNVNTNTSPKSNPSHTFDIIDIEMYAIFTILWFLLFVFSMFLCFRLHITLEFFRNIRTVVLLVIVFIFEIFYYFIFCFILWINSIAYSNESSINFYIWSCYLPIILHISLLFSLCAYYNKHFHRDEFLNIFCCFGNKKRKIPKILKQFNFILFLFFIIPMICVIGTHLLIIIIVFISIFGLIGLIISLIQLITSIIDLKNIKMYEQKVEKVLVIFVFINSILFIIIFAVNLTIAFEWNAMESGSNIAAIRITQLIFEFLMLIALQLLIFYIYYDYIMGIIEDEEESQTENSQNQSQKSMENTDTETLTENINMTEARTNLTQIGTESFNDLHNNNNKQIFNDPSDDETNSNNSNNVIITRRSSKKIKTKQQMGLSINTNNKMYQKTPELNDDYVVYNVGDAVDIFQIITQLWVKAIVLDVENNCINVRVLDGPNIHDELVIDLNNGAHKVRLSGTSTPQDLVRDKYKSSPPPSLDVALARQSKIKKAKSRKLPELPLFGAPLSKQKLITVTDNDYEYYSDIPYALVLCKKYLFKFHGYKYLGIFANGELTNINKSPRFMDGVVSKIDVNGVKKLIENNKISKHNFTISKKGEERHYAMIFSELIKSWLNSLPEPLLQHMSSTFFINISNIEFLQVECSKINEPNLSTLLFIWDICVEISIKSKINKMTIKKLSQLFAPFLYKDSNRQKDLQIRPNIVKFCEIGINWRKESSIND